MAHAGHHYRVAGLRVHSDIALPSLIHVGSAESVDIVVRAGDVPDFLDDATSPGLGWQLAGDRLLIDLPGIVRMLMIGGRELVYCASGAMDSDEAPIFITGTGLGILLHQRRTIVLHASAVRVGGHAVLFCGPSGAGKSTLAAALVESGLDLIADDFCAIATPPGAAPSVSPDGRQLKLWQEATDGLELADRRGAPVRRSISKFYVEPRSRSETPLPIAAIYALRPARGRWTQGIHAPNMVDAALIVRRNAYRPLLVDHLGQAQLYFEAATRIAHMVGIFSLARTLEFAAMPTVIAMLRAHWQELGAMERAA